MPRSYAERFANGIKGKSEITGRSPAPATSPSSTSPHETAAAILGWMG